MKVIRHRDGTYSLKNMSYKQLSALVLTLHHNLKGKVNPDLSDDLKEELAEVIAELEPDKKKLFRELERYF